MWQTCWEGKSPIVFSLVLVIFYKARLKHSFCKKKKRFENLSYLFNALFEQKEYWKKVQHYYSKVPLLSTN